MRTSSSKTILLIHGLWMSPASWTLFHDFYELRGFKVIAPPWPRMADDVGAIRRNPSALAGLGLAEVASHYGKIIRELDEPPILIGHSMGGLIVQMLLDRGLGSVGVAIDSATPKGIYRLPRSVLKSSNAVLSNPLNFWRTVSLTFDQFRYAFAHVMPEKEARDAYERFNVPGPGRPIFEVALGNFNPWAVNRIHYRASDRAPLLLIAGSDDRLVPPILNSINARLYRHSPALVAYKEFPGRSHLIVAQKGWQEVADYALAWALNATANHTEATKCITLPQTTTTS